MRTLFLMDEKNYDPGGTKGYRPSARGIIVKNGKLALVHSLEYDYYKFPGGGIDSGESNEEALIREVREETGLSVIPSSVREYGSVRRIQKGTIEDIFIQDNYYYLCDTEDIISENDLDDYEKEERFTLEFVSPEHAADVNRNHSHGSKDKNDHFNVMLERENNVLDMLINENILKGRDSI